MSFGLRLSVCLRMMLLLILPFLLVLCVPAVSGQSCAIDPYDRTDCYQGSEAACNAQGCCWSPTWNGGPAWCFYPTSSGAEGAPVFVMVPLDIVNPSNPSQLAYRDTLVSWLTKLKQQANIDGIMADVWWGVVEQTPQVYNFAAYLQLAEICNSLGLKMNVVTSFHSCGGNVGDNCDIPLPSWVLETSGVYYTDQYGNVNKEYLTLGVDELRLFRGRSPIEIYRDYFRAFQTAFQSYLSQGLIEEIEVGVGPSGELRYPAYPLDKWTFPGVGGFQCYDAYMLADLKGAANATGYPEWGYPPTNAGGYNSRPEDTQFFSNNQPNNWNSDYGKFFLGWYSQSLINHGERVLDQAASVFTGYPTHYSIKISGVHWLYNTDSHGAELTAGYYNTVSRDGYTPIISILKAENASFDFTCLEMKNSEQPANARSNPEQLVAQTRRVCENNQVKYRGENALQRYDSTAYNQIVYQSRFSSGEPINGFTYLRLTSDLINNSGYFEQFRIFVSNMHAL